MVWLDWSFFSAAGFKYSSNTRHSETFCFLFQWQGGWYEYVTNDYVDSMTSETQWFPFAYSNDNRKEIGSNEKWMSKFENYRIVKCIV